MVCQSLVHSSSQVLKYFNIQQAAVENPVKDEAKTQDFTIKTRKSTDIFPKILIKLVE